MKNNQFLKIIQISFSLFILVNATMITTSSKTDQENTEGIAFFSDSDCGINLINDSNLPPCYVMENVTIPLRNSTDKKPNTFASLPSEFSWKSYQGKDFTTPAKSQGSCGSCWAFAAVSCFESLIDIAWNSPDLDVDLSEQYILSCLPQSGSCNGGWSSSALNLIKSTSRNGNYHNGLIPEECFPYRAIDSIPCSDKCENWDKKLFPLADYGSWKPDFPSDIDRIKSSIMTYGPVITAFYATGDFARWGYENQQPTDYYPYVERSGANHAVCIVGWKDDPSIGNGGYWIVKNSWGTNWGYDGFFNIEYGSLNIDDVDITWAQYDAKPIAQFSFLPQNPNLGEPIQFSDESYIPVGDLVEWEWEFGDGNTSTDQNPTHTYQSNGIYTVTLTVKDLDSHANAFTKKLYVGDDTPPTTSYDIHGFMGENDWYTGFVSLSFISSDSFSGVDSIWYNLDNQGYREYTGRINFFNKPEGKHTITYYAVDNASNKEDEKSLNFKIDRTDPSIKAIKPRNDTLYINNIPLFRSLNRTVIIGFVNARYGIQDNESGIEKVEFYLDNKLMKRDYNPPYRFITSGRNIGRLSIIEVIAYDNAGRTGELQQYVILSSLGILGLLN